MTSLGRARSAAERVNVMSGRVLGTYERVALSVGRPARLTIVIVSRSHWIEREVTDEASCLDEFAVAIDEALECEPAGSHQYPWKAWIACRHPTEQLTPVTGWTWRPPQ